MKVIEPDEIFVDAHGTVQDKVSHVDPWSRLFARVFDYALFCGALWVAHAAVDLDTLLPYEYFLWIPVEALLVMLWATTPGKWLLATRLEQKFRRGRISYTAALKRAFGVWVKGIGLGIPFVNAICMLVAFRTLILRKTTSWDATDHFVITHRPIARWRRWVVALLGIAGLITYEVYGRRV